MYQKFTVNQLRVHEEDNCIVLGFTLDLDEDTVNESTIYIAEPNNETQPLGQANISVEDKNVTIEYKDLKVNTDYVLHVTNEIQSITEDNLDMDYQKLFRIESAVDANVEVLSPSDYEEVDGSLHVTLRELVGKSKQTFNCFDIQVATDVRFNDIVVDTSLFKKNECSIASLKPSPRNQYYIRARVTDGDTQKGNWSKKVTFTTKKFDEKNSAADSDDDDFPIFVEGLKLIGYPENGETPKSFILEFDEELDPDSFNPDDLILMRKKV